MSLEIAQLKKPVDDNIVETLEHLLERAKAGELVCMAVVGADHRNDLVSAIHFDGLTQECLVYRALGLAQARFDEWTLNVTRAVRPEDLGPEDKDGDEPEEKDED